MLHKCLLPPPILPSRCNTYLLHVCRAAGCGGPTIQNCLDQGMSQSALPKEGCEESLAFGSLRACASSAQGFTCAEASWSCLLSLTEMERRGLLRLALGATSLCPAAGSAGTSTDLDKPIGSAAVCCVASSSSSFAAARTRSCRLALLIPAQ